MCVFYRSCVSLFFFLVQSYIVYSLIRVALWMACVDGFVSCDLVDGEDGLRTKSRLT